AVKERPMRRGGKPLKPKVGARPAAGSGSLKKEGSTVRELETRLAEALRREAEALEQQKATAELLQARDRDSTELQEQQPATSGVPRVISTPPTDLEPVLEAVARTSARLCDAVDVTILRVDGAILRAVAHQGSIPVTSELFHERGGLPIERGYVTGCAVLD